LKEFSSLLFLRQFARHACLSKLFLRRFFFRFDIHVFHVFRIKLRLCRALIDEHIDERADDEIPRFLGRFGLRRKKDDQKQKSQQPFVGEAIQEFQQNIYKITQFFHFLFNKSASESGFEMRRFPKLAAWDGIQIAVSKNTQRKYGRKSGTLCRQDMLSEAEALKNRISSVEFYGCLGIYFF
jgi:hypothetical protein